MSHVPVLLRPTLNLLALPPGAKVVDGTLGEGGHAQAILAALGPKGKLLGIDADSENIGRAGENLKKFGQQIILVNDNFANLAKIVEENNFLPIQAILLDLGWSSTQFAESGRGFSFQTDEPLDMRLNTGSDLTAAQILNDWKEEEIGRVFREYGEEKNWRTLAKKIVEFRKKYALETTGQLVSIIGEERGRSKIHPATRVFQALRMAVNKELDNLAQVLPQAVRVLAPGGRLGIITFHSLEDRIVKRFFQKENNKSLRIITKKPVSPTAEEVAANPRSRSAKLRVAEKI